MVSKTSDHGVNSNKRQNYEQNWHKCFEEIFTEMLVAFKPESYGGVSYIKL